MNLHFVVDITYYKLIEIYVDTEPFLYSSETYLTPSLKNSKDIFVRNIAIFTVDV